MDITIVERTANTLYMEIKDTIFFAEWDKYSKKWIFRLTEDFTPIGDGYFNPSMGTYTVMDPIIGANGNKLYNKFIALMEC